MQMCVPISQDRLGCAVIMNNHTHHHPELPQISLKNVFLVLIILQLQIGCVSVSQLTLVTPTGEGNL